MITTDKNAARDRMKAVRAALTAEQRAAQSVAVAAFAPHDLFAGPPRIVSGYLPIRDELDPRSLMTALASRGHTLALPVMEGRAHPLRFRAWRPGDALTRAEWGIMEPTAEAPTVVPDIMLVPLLAIDRVGNRLGYGAGHYDRSIAAVRRAKAAVTIGVAFDTQVVDDVPHDARDEPLDAVLTAGGLTVFQAPSTKGSVSP